MSRVSQLNELVDFKLKASLDYVLMESPEVRIRPLIEVSVSPIVGLEVEKVRLLNFSIDLDVLEDFLTLYITFHVSLEKKTPHPSISSLLRRFIPSRETVTIKKNISISPTNIIRYWEIIYLALKYNQIIVKLYYRESEKSGDAHEYILNLRINEVLEIKIIEAFQRYILKNIPPKIYSNPSYLKVLKNHNLLNMLAKEVLEQLAGYGLIKLVGGRLTGWRLTRFGRMYLLWAAKRGKLFAKTLVDIMHTVDEVKIIERPEEDYKDYKPKIKEELKFNPERFYPCIEEFYAERLSEEFIKNGVLTPTQSYLAGRLREYFSSTPDKPFIVYGVRGVGKTFTVRYVLGDNYRYTYVDKEDWSLKSISKGEPTVEVFDDWHYLCEGVIRGLIGPEEFKSFLEKLRDGMGVKHVVLVSDEMPSAYLYKLPQELAGIVEELVGLTIKGKLNLQNVNILELEPSSVADYLKHIEGAENSKQFIEFLCKGRLRRLAKILKQFNGVPPIEKLIQLVGERLEIDGDSSRLLLAKLRNDEEELKKIVSEILNKYVKPVEKSKRRKRKRRRKTGQPLLRKRPKTRTDKLQLEEAKKKLEATFREILFTIESNLPKLFGEEVLER